MYLGSSEWKCVTIILLQSTGCLFSQSSAAYLYYPIMTMNVNGTSKIFCIVSQVTKKLFGSSYIQ